MRVTEELVKWYLEKEEADKINRRIAERRKNEKNISSFPKKTHLYNITETLRYRVEQKAFGVMNADRE